MLRSRGRSSGSGASADRLDLAFYEAKVLPIFNTLGEDGQNCVGCHRSHTILKLVPPGKDGTWTPNAVRANFRATLRVVNLASPRDSLLLGKPTWEAAEEAEAQSDPTKKAHAGGVRFDRGTLGRVPDDPRLDQRRPAPRRGGGAAAVRAGLASQDGAESEGIPRKVYSARLNLRDRPGTLEFADRDRSIDRNVPIIEWVSSRHVGG